MALDKNKHLQDVLSTHKISKEQALLDKHKVKRNEIDEALTEHFGSDIYKLFNSGSYAKNTAVNTKFDFDLMSPFKRDAFGTLEEMFNAVFDFLNEKYNTEAVVRKQKVSIGLEFYQDADGDVIKIDVVPGRELNKDQYKDDDKLNLYVHSQFGLFEQGNEHLRSNVKAQVENIRSNADKDSLRKMIRLMKIWKIHNHKPAKSFLLELIIIKAFEKKDITGDLWDKLKTVMEYIRDNIKTVSLPDPGNSGNNVADSMTEWDKNQMSTDMDFIITRVEDDADNLPMYFPLNPKFPVEETKNSYGQKSPGISVPPPARFG